MSFAGDWLKKENEAYVSSIAGLLAALVFTADKKAYICQQPFDFNVSLVLFVFVALLRLKVHVCETRLEGFSRRLTVENLGKLGMARLTVRGDIYLFALTLLSLAVMHVYLFLPAMMFFVITDIISCAVSLKYLEKIGTDWAEGVFDPYRLFRGWIALGVINVIGIILLVIMSLFFVADIRVALVEYFAFWLTGLDIFADLMIGRDFYFNYYYHAEAEPKH
ncbi:MAG TPA: hypothetical protein P5110_04275 [Candidatus Omnitrophota bacterium]|nr:hypothetical protein [Candidatus Omnitrophota bacterium]HRZ14709.1 hypothetical protein [Candidatus Omnitrophota bacterium]